MAAIAKFMFQRFHQGRIRGGVGVADIIHRFDQCSSGHIEPDPVRLHPGKIRVGDHPLCHLLESPVDGCQRRRAAIQQPGLGWFPGARMLKDDLWVELVESHKLHFLLTAELVLVELVLALVFNDLVVYACLLYTSPSPRDQRGSRMPSSA